MKILLTMHSKLDFFSLNVGMSSTLAGLPAIIKAEVLDIIFLQEVRLSSGQIEHLLKWFAASAKKCFLKKTTHILFFVLFGLKCTFY